MKRIATMALAILMVGTLLTGCGDKAKGSNSNSNGDETVYTFKMANQAPPGDPQYDSSFIWKKFWRIAAAAALTSPIIPTARWAPATRSRPK